MPAQPFILVVDDEEVFREIFSKRLTADGFHVDVAENGQAALGKMKDAVPDLVLMDVKMPVMDGAATVLAMREDPRLRNVKVVFLTSLGDPRMDMEELGKKFSQDFGAQGYLRKTDDLDGLMEKIKAFF